MEGAGALSLKDGCWRSLGMLTAHTHEGRPAAQSKINSGLVGSVSRGLGRVGRLAHHAWTEQ